MYVYIYIINTLGIYTLHDMKGDGHTFYKKTMEVYIQMEVSSKWGSPKKTIQVIRPW